MLTLTQAQLDAQNASKGISQFNTGPAEVGTVDITATPAQTAPTEANGGSTGASTDTSAPDENLQKGAKGTDVSQLQSFLSSTINPQTGNPYLSQQQIATGSGIYGPQTMAAVAQLQKDLGVQAGANAGQYGPKTRAAIANKYQNAFKTVQNTKVPDQTGLAKQQIQDNTQTQQSTDPVFNAMSSSLGPIMDSLNQVLQNINNPSLTAVSLQTEYNQLQEQYGPLKMQSDLMNMQNVMNGTTDDIRQEIQKGGGEATESQVMAMSAARNNVILKQYNALATQYQAAQTNVQNMMQYATTDQATQLKRQTDTASVVESMASIAMQAQSMGQTMFQNANTDLNKVVSNIGYTGLADQAQGDPQKLAQYEKILGLSSGALSDPTALKQMETYRQQQLSVSQQKIVLQYGTMPSSPTNPSPTTSTTPGVDSSTGLISPVSTTSANGGDILSATGLSVQEFAYLTLGQTALTRMPIGAQNQLKARVDNWLKKNSVDISTLQSQYKANNTTLSNNISRFNNTTIAEGEVLGTLSNIDSTAVAAGLGDVNITNVGKVLAGQQVNDPKANEYSFYFNDLKNSLAYYYAAQQGKASPDVIDNQDAANVIVGGLAKGGVKGLQTAVTSTTVKMKGVLSKAVDDARQNVWSLFGVGDKYQSSARPIKVKSPDGNLGTIPASQLKDALANGYSQI